MPSPDVGASAVLADDEALSLHSAGALAWLAIVALKVRLSLPLSLVVDVEALVRPILASGSLLPASTAWSALLRARDAATPLRAPIPPSSC